MIRNHLASLLLSFMYGSSPDPIRLALESTSARWFRGVWISGFVVAVGCMFEIWEVAFDFRNWRRHRKNIPPLPENPGSWMYPLAAMGLFLVVGGIVGETIFEVLASNSDAAIRSYESDKISAAETSASDAATSAKNAKADALVANGKADDVGKKADAAQLKIAGVQRRADVLAYFLSARRVQDEDGLRNDLEKYKGRRMTFDSYVGDEEAYWMCSQLFEAAKKAGVDAIDQCAAKRLSSSLPIMDLHISAPSIEEGGSLSTVFKKSRRVPGYQVGLNVSPDIVVTVGAKPSIPLYPMVKKATSKK